MFANTEIRLNSICQLSLASIQTMWNHASLSGASTQIIRDSQHYLFRQSCEHSNNQEIHRKHCIIQSFLCCAHLSFFFFSFSFSFCSVFAREHELPHNIQYISWSPVGHKLVSVLMKWKNNVPFGRALFAFDVCAAIISTGFLTVFKDIER